MASEPEIWLSEPPILASESEIWLSEPEIWLSQPEILALGPSIWPSLDLVRSLGSILQKWPSENLFTDDVANFAVARGGISPAQLMSREGKARAPPAGLWGLSRPEALWERFEGGRERKAGEEGPQRGPETPERPREAQRGPERPRGAQRGPERPREVQRGQEKRPERPREAFKGPSLIAGGRIY